MTELNVSYAEKTVDFLPLLIARDAGYFKKRGLDVNLLYLPAQLGIPALITNQVKIACVGASDAVSAEAEGVKLKLVATLTPVYPFQFWARPKYDTASALKGQRVGITSTTGSLYAATLLALKQIGLQTTDVSLTPLGSSSNVNSSLLAGSIAAGASHPPATYEFEKAGFKLLVNLAEKKIPAVSAGVWVTQSYMEVHRDVVQKVVDSVIEALRREKSDRAYTESEISKYLGVKDKGELDFTYDFYVKDVLAPEPVPETEQIASNIDALSAGNPKLKTIDVSSMIDQSFVKNARNGLKP